MKKNPAHRTRSKGGIRQSRSARKILQGIFFSVVALSVILAAYVFYLSVQIEKRFSGRRWSIPSKVFSDTTLLYPGQSFHRISLEKKLERLGYRNVNHSPEKKGEMRLTGNRWEIFLNDLQVPHSKRQGFPLALTPEGKRIGSVVNLQTRKPVTFFELEPELLMLFFGAQREQRELVSIREVPPATSSMPCLPLRTAGFTSTSG